MGFFGGAVIHDPELSLSLSPSVSFSSVSYKCKVFVLEYSTRLLMPLRPNVLRP